jgi:hypothetical protein
MSADDVGAGSSAGFSTRLDALKPEHSSLVLLQAVGGFALLLQMGLAAIVFETSGYNYVSSVILDTLAIGSPFPLSQDWVVEVASFLVVAIPTLLFEVARQASGRPGSRLTSVVRAAVWLMPFVVCAAAYGRNVHHCMFLGPERPTHLISCFRRLY